MKKFYSVCLLFYLLPSSAFAVATVATTTGAQTIRGGADTDAATASPTPFD